MNVVPTAPSPGMRTPSLPLGSSILTPFCTTLPPLKIASHYIGTSRGFRRLRRFNPRHRRNPRLLLNSKCVPPLHPARPQVVPVHSRNHFELDLLRTYRFAFADICTGAEEFLLHLRHHIQSALMPLRLALGQETEMADFRAREKSRCGVGTCGDAGATTNAGGRIHSEIRILLWNRNNVSVRCAAGPYGNVPAGRNDPVEGAAIHNEILYR